MQCDMVQAGPGGWSSHLQLGGTCNKTIPKEKLWAESASVSYALWRPGSEWNKTGLGHSHTLASTGGYGSWRGAGLAGSRGTAPQEFPEGTGLWEARGEGSSDVQMRHHQWRGMTGNTASRRARRSPRGEGICNRL